ncbi:tRNA(adenine34) deaminase [Anseongella ginsenosidimutans]|uniref:tRNA-specific adenosine deaminase n=1 Tax=Anseongella ginsenosidimutans TaxID=496056 RepID=A0A4R3KXC1_9SPHI|nr:nucleoside deaminase [Anseongella ginsenosidimutans]QEC51411.1 nucleoside deaminase [Anseongella ginsenosidimutans]TCS89884.1 tRNA(adenine34) deaminase [Anseongella ginsenosidimutans]
MIEAYSDEYFMREALKEAEKAYEEEEIPVGALVVAGNRIIGRGHNLTERLNDVTAHAEMQALTAAAGYLGGKYLDECSLYVTLEPCVMCAGAAYWFQLNKIVFGAYDKKRGFGTIGSRVLHPKTQLTGGIMEAECGALIQEFFRRKR